MNECLFCKITEGVIPSEKIYEDDHIFAFLDHNPVNPGHTLVVPKEHSLNLYEANDETLEKMVVVIKRLSIAIKEALNADGINLEMNNDPAAGQIIMHTHIHIVPRFKEDGFRHWPGTPYEEGVAKITADKIKSAI